MAVVVEGGDDLVQEEDRFVPLYIPTPHSVRAIYMSQCVVGTPSFREDLVELIDETELNAVVIDVKDYTGKLGFTTDNPKIAHAVSDECGAVDMRDFLKYLNEKEIYTIARITVFQDPYYTSIHPELAVKKESSTSTVWTDHKGLAFIEVGARPFWEYIVDVSLESHKIGFDELNYDYIRFPSDGDMYDIYYPFSNDLVEGDHRFGKARALEEFFAYLDKEVRQEGVVTSADIFGMTTTNTDDLNIGQVLERAEPYFDYLAPMVYPSHYPPTFNGYGNPNDYPYEVVHYSMKKAHDRLVAATTSPLKLRPWLQDFDYGGDYDADDVRAQIQATYDSGLTSWMLWSPSNRYTRAALFDTMMGSSSVAN